MTFDRLSHKKAIHSLTNRVGLLENLLIKHGIEIPLEGAIESHSSTLESRRDSGNNERANEEAAGGYTLSDCDQSRHRPESENAAQSTQSVLSFLGMNELGILQSDHTDLIDLFQSLAALWQSVYDFNQTNDKSQGIMKNPEQAILPDCNSVQAGSNASTSCGTSCGESTIPNTSANTILTVQRPGYCKIGRPRMGIFGGSGPLSCVLPQNCFTEQNRQVDNDEIMGPIIGEDGRFPDR